MRLSLATLALLVASSAFVLGPSSAEAQAPAATVSREPALQKRIPREQAWTTTALEGTVREEPARPDSRPVAGARILLRQTLTHREFRAVCSGDGAFRIFPLEPGTYDLQVDADGYSSFSISTFALHADEVAALEVHLRPSPSASLASRLPRQPELGPPPSAVAVSPANTYRELRHRLDGDPDYILEPVSDALPPAADVFHPVSNRWELPQPSVRRYATATDAPYVRPHWYDPYNLNRWKGDEPIWPEVFGQQVFLNFTGTADTFLDGRRVPTPTGVTPAQPGTSNFFGNGGQLFLDQTFRFSFDLFHGDTSFKPADWRIRVTPEVSLNYLSVQELGIVNADPRAGTTRFDDQIGLQEAFFEYKLHDLSPNYDFISARAGIQQFNADFRGFLFVDEQPGLRLFGDLRSDRVEYNAAYFNFLEKNTNSGLNTFELRNQQVVLANIYIQDFFFPGYTAEFVGAWNKDDGGLHYDDNGFLVRPEPIGTVVDQDIGAILHGIRVGYFGWLGSGHIRRLNLTHAFYEAAGKDTFNPMAGKSVTVNAQMAAAELSLDRDWIRYRVSAFYASGDANPRDSRARGFDSIVDLPNFAGGLFSFWNREAIRLTGTGVALTQDGSLLPNMRSSKEEGQANFVNPGIFLVNAGADFDITPKLKGFANFNFLRFLRTEPIEYVFFDSPIHHTIGDDLGVGVQYRPPLSENLVLSGGGALLQPGQGFKDIYTGRTQFSVFGQAKFTF